jgi:hypothetical protein
MEIEQSISVVAEEQKKIVDNAPREVSEFITLEGEPSIPRRSRGLTSPKCVINSLSRVRIHYFLSGLGNAVKINVWQIFES